MESLMMAICEKPTFSHGQTKYAKPTSSKISNFEIDGITFEVGGKKKMVRKSRTPKEDTLSRITLNMLQGNQCPYGCLVFSTDYIGCRPLKYSFLFFRK